MKRSKEEDRHERLEEVESNVFSGLIGGIEMELEARP